MVNNVSICRGMPVIRKYNNNKYDIVSNETFFIKQIIKEIVRLQGEDTIINIELNEFKKLYCIKNDDSIFIGMVVKQKNEEYTVIKINNTMISLKAVDVIVDIE